MDNKVYHILVGNASITLCLFLNTEKKVLYGEYARDVRDNSNFMPAYKNVG